MVLFWITLVLTLIGTNADGEFYVLHSPSSLTFLRTIDTYESLLKEIFCAALGLSVEQNAEWNGLYVMDPFNTIEAAVEVYIDGVASLGENAGLNSKVFPLIVNEYEPDTFKGIKLRIKQRLDFGDNKIVNIKLSDENKFPQRIASAEVVDGSNSNHNCNEIIDHCDFDSDSKSELNTIKNVFGNVNVMSYKALSALKLIHLKQTVEEDRHFISELGTLLAIIGKVQAGALVPDNLIDFYNFRFRSLHALSDFYGPISRQTKEAKKLLGDALQELCKAFVKAYDGSVLVTVVTTDVAHTRRSARSLTNPPGHSKKWPYQWLEPPLSRQKISFKPANARRDVENRGGNPAKNSGGNSTTGPPGSPRGPTTSRTATANKMSLKKGEYLAPLQSADNAAIFNILLWFGVVISFSMLAIIYACMDMDPGRDTIIYRMTTMRTKKDL